MVEIPELVGKKTGVKTRVGRPVYKTNEGEFVSEKGVSIPLNKNKTKWLIAPSIYHGVSYTDDQIKKFYEQGKIKKSDYKIISGTAKDAAEASKKRSAGLLTRKQYKTLSKKKFGGRVGVGVALRGYGKVRSYK